MQNNDDDKVLDDKDKPVSTNDDDVGNNHQIPSVPKIDEGGVEESQFSDPVASPSVTGEENVFSGDTTEGEAADIDEELKKVGLDSDENGPKPLSSDDIDY